MPGNHRVEFPAASLFITRRSLKSSRVWWLARSMFISAPTRFSSRKSSTFSSPANISSFSVHVDSQKEHHDFSVCREGGYEIALDGIRAAVKAGFGVTTNTTLFDGADPRARARSFDEMMEVGVESMMVSPGYSYDKAPDQKHFMGRARTRRLFRAMLSNRSRPSRSPR